MLRPNQNRLHRQHVKQSFDARMEMEKRAQIEVDARLKAVELTLKNQGHIK